MKKQVRFYNIEWETDGENADLPEEVTREVDTGDLIPQNYLQNYGADILSDEFGWLIASFDFYILPT